MNNKFVPLALPGKPAADSGSTVFRVKVLPPAEGQAAPFAPSPSSSANPPPVTSSRSGDLSAEVKLERDAQQRISRIHVQCSCGQAHQLDCSYE